MCQVTDTQVFLSDVCGFVSFFKKRCCSTWRGRVRQKPLAMVQLDLFDDGAFSPVPLSSGDKVLSYDKVKCTFRWVQRDVNFK